jgi:ABC-type multidrug transport system fused ATPase/permease subunit
LRVFGIFIISICINLVQTKGISETTSKLIDAVHHNRIPNIMKLFYTYSGLLLFMLLLFYAYYSLENTLAIKLKSWARHKILEALILVNQERFSDENFTKLNSPIHRLSDLFVSIMSNVISTILPNSLYLLVVTGFFMSVSPVLALFFLVGNIIVAIYYYFIFDKLIAANIEYEKNLYITDSHLIDVLNNMDKIVYRNQSKKEIDSFSERTTINITSGTQYYNTMKFHSTIASLVILIVMVLSIWYMIRMVLKKQMTPVFFVTSITILFLYKEKIEWLLSEIPDTVGYIGRIQTTLSYFGHLESFYETILKNNRFKEQVLKFQTIEFKNVYYKYKFSTKNVFENRSYYINSGKNHIIGITGPSGRGKSTFVKLLLKMYKCDKGEILIDGVNINTINPSYIREHITYVNQNSKLFDKKVLDNLLYGCSDIAVCVPFLKRILSYPNIARLFKNVDIKNKDSGMLGENLSGGQRQVINVIGGLINPSKILILDEPTNALDPSLKKELIELIQEFKKYKQCVIIITHDPAVFPIFDTELKI